MNAWQSFADSLLRKLKRWPSWLKDHFEIIGIHTHFLKCSNKIPRGFFQKIKLLAVLYNNKIITSEVIFSTREKSFLSFLELNVPVNK